MSTLICFALKEEAAPFRKMAAGKSGISILIVGIVRQNYRVPQGHFENSPAFLTPGSDVIAKSPEGTAKTHSVPTGPGGTRRFPNQSRH
jgi:hypothetical protein